MKICMIIPSLRVESGGPPKICLEMSMELAAQGIEVVIATCHYGSRRPEKLSRSIEGFAEAGVTVRSFRKWGWGDFGVSPGFMRYMATHARTFSIVHIHGMWLPELAWASFCAHRSKTPYVVHPHGSLDRWSLTQSRLKKQISMKWLGSRQMLDRAVAILYGTVDEAEEAAELGLAAAVEIIPNGIRFWEASGYRSERVSILAELFPDFRDSDYILLWFSRFHPKKGLHLLIDAFARIAPDFPQAKLLAAGLPQNRSYLTEQMHRVQQLGLQDRITITSGYTGEDARRLQGVVDIFVQPSYEEGFSIAILEAMTSALPLLITDKCHLPETESRAAGVEVSASIDGLSAGLQTLLALPKQELSDMGQRALNWVQTEYSWNAVGQKLIAVYRNHLA